MKAVSEHLYQRGKQKILWVRRRIPNALRLCYPPKKTHLAFSLGTSDLREGKVLARAAMQRIDAEFAQKQHHRDLSRASQSRTHIATLSTEEVEKAGRYWIRDVLRNDEKLRKEGLDDEDFDELGARLHAQRAELGRMLAQGRTKAILPAMQQYLSFCGIDYAPSEEEAQKASYLFARAVVEALDHQIHRQGGGVLNVDDVAPETPHPLDVVKGVGAPKNSSKEANGPTWSEVFELWRTYVDDRPKATSIAAQTPWRDLQRFVKEKEVFYPGDVTALHLTEFAQEMRERELAVDTINERISKIKGIYKIAVGRHKLEVNPAAETLGFKNSSVEKRTKKRKPFSELDLAVIFDSPVFTEHKRSSGQSGEASYWIPVLMYYTGARPEELAGLALHDIKLAEGLGWYIDIMYSPTDDESDDLGVPRIPDSHKRTLKNQPSIRSVPLSPQLMKLGFLSYIEWIRNSGSVMLFPTLMKDSQDKLTGAFSKFFGRYKKQLGIIDPKKVLYSFRHNMKDFLEQAEFPPNYKKRFIGHASGDGQITDGYGSDLPLDIMFKHCQRLKFAAIAAKPWKPGVGPVRF